MPKATDDWYNGMDLGKLVGILFIDLKREFFTVDEGIYVKNWCIMAFKSGN